MKKSDTSKEMEIELHNIEGAILHFDYESGTVDECTKRLQALKDQRDVLRHRLGVSRRVEATEQVAAARANLAKLKNDKIEVVRDLEQITATVIAALGQYYGNRTESMAASTIQVMEASDRLNALRSRIDAAQMRISELARAAATAEKDRSFDK